MWQVIEYQLSTLHRGLITAVLTRARSFARFGVSTNSLTPALITARPSANRWLHQIEPLAEEVWNLPDLMWGATFPEFILGFVNSFGGSRLST